MFSEIWIICSLISFAMTLTLKGEKEKSLQNVIVGTILGPITIGFALASILQYLDELSEK